MWTIVNKPTQQKMNFALAKEFRDMEPCPQDRPISKRRLDSLLRCIEAGEFRSCTWARAYCEETKKWYRINGKHTSFLFAEMPGRDMKNAGAYVTIEEYSCPTMEDVARLYSSFDNRMSMRSAGDINLVFAATNEELLGMKGRVVNLVVSAIVYAKYGDESHKRPPVEERASTILEHPGFAKWVEELVTPKEASHVRRAAVIAAAFLSWKKSKTDATAFWNEVADGSNIDHRSPSRHLQRYLLRTASACGSGAKLGKEMAGRREIMVKCIHAWNAFRRDQSTDLKYHASSKVPGVA